MKWLAIPLSAVFAVGAYARGTTIVVAPDGRSLADAVVESRLAAKPVILLLRGGTYFLAQPLVLDARDAGLTLAAYRREKPVLSGGRRITGWQAAPGGVWTARVPTGGHFRELWVNGQRRTRARHPNAGYFAVLENPDGGAWTNGSRRFRFKAGDLKAWPSITNADLVVMNRWAESRVPLAGVDEKDGIVTLGRRTLFTLDPGDLYYVEGIRDVCDVPGEWYLADDQLYYRPMPDEDPTTAEVVAPALAQLVRLANITNLTMRGLTFAHTEWYYPKDFKCSWPSPEIQGFTQAAFGVPGAVGGDGARLSCWERCTFEHLGTYGLELARGCQSNQVTGCVFRDLGAGGIKLGETVPREPLAEQTFGNEISDCRIQEGGKLFPSAVGIWVGQSHDNRIAHNLIQDFYYSGISIGWTWGYGASQAQGNLVEWNHVHHIGKLSNGDGPILSDMGGIYTLGNQQGGVVRNNFWHDIDAVRYGGWGIYFDEGTTGLTASNNIVVRTKDGGFHQHYGRDNVVRNNIFAYARMHQLQRTRAEAHRSFTFEHNLILWAAGKAVAGQWNNDPYTVSSNLFWCTSGPVGELPARFQAGHTLVADPLFVNPAVDDFRQRRGSPAHRIGFQPFQLKAVGPRR